MGKFNAAQAVESLEYDFTAFGGPAGTIPEPSNKQVKTFFNTVRAISQGLRLDDVARAGELDEAAQKDLAEFLAGLTDEQLEEREDDIAQAVHDLCSGTPSAEEYKNLPYRVQGAFGAWLAGELRPEPPRPATKR